jgi:Zn-dependent peptidase ImmA (M78 family)
MLDLGPVPALRLVERIESELDIPVLFINTPIPSDKLGISGAMCHLNDLGVILINRNESEGRRYYDLAHELFHALTWDAMGPEHRESNSPENRASVKRIEQLADNFAASLLMPLESLRAFIDPHRCNDTSHLSEIAGQLHVTNSALAYRLFNMNAIDELTKNKLIREHQYSYQSTAPKLYSFKVVKLLYQSIDKGRLSARKAAKALGMNLTQLSEVFIEHEMITPFEF